MTPEMKDLKRFVYEIDNDLDRLDEKIGGRGWDLLKSVLESILSNDLIKTISWIQHPEMHDVSLFQINESDFDIDVEILIKDPGFYTRIQDLYDIWPAMPYMLKILFGENVHVTAFKQDDRLIFKVKECYE